MVKILDTIENLENVTRVEVIDNHGRSYIHYNAESVEYSLQDDGKTLKIFIMDKKIED